MDAILARLDAARCASWRESHVGAQFAGKIVLDSAVGVACCVVAVLAAFVWLAVFAPRRFSLAGLGREAGMKRRSDAVIKRIVMLPVCVEIFLCEPTGSPGPRSAIPSPPVLVARVARQAVATPARQRAFSAACVTCGL